MENEKLGKVNFTSVEFNNGYAAVMCKKDYDTLSVIVAKDLLLELSNKTPHMSTTLNNLRGLCMEIDLNHRILHYLKQ